MHLHLHTCHPKIAFPGTKITKIRNTAWFSGTHQQTYPHINEINLATIVYRKITGQSTLHASRFRAAENDVCQSCLTVRQFNHFTTLPQTSEFRKVSPFSSMVAKDHFSGCTFLNIWKRLLFAGDGFAGARSKDLAMLSVIHETFSQMAPWFLSTWLAASWKLRRSFFCFVSIVHTQSASESKSALFSVFCACAMCPKVTSVSFGTNASASHEKAVFVVVFQEWQNPEPLRGYLYFWKVLLIFIIFKN